MKISILLRLIDKAGPGSICPIAHHKHQCESAEFETRPFVVKALDVYSSSIGLFYLHSRYLAQILVQSQFGTSSFGSSSRSN